MAKTLYFNRETGEQLYLDEDQHRQQINDLMERGWMPNPPLVHMYHPERNCHDIVHVDDAGRFEQNGFYRAPTWVYHPEHGTRMVPLEKAAEMYTQGWYDNPGKFPGKPLGTMKVKAQKEAA